MRLSILALAFSLTLVLPTTVFANEPPTPEPPEWDKSSIAVEGACVEGVPTFTITNHGADMQGTSAWYVLGVDGGASTCAAAVADGYISTGAFQLAENESVIVSTSNGTPPVRFCVQQRAGHPGIGWASATVTSEDAQACATAEDEVDEGTVRELSLLFIPALAR